MSCPQTCKFSCVLYSHLGQEDFQDTDWGVTPLPAMNGFSAHTWVAADCTWFWKGAENATT